MDSRKECQENCLHFVDTITLTCSDISVTEPRTISVEGFVHGCGKIGHNSLKQWLPMSQIPGLLAIEFEPVYPGHGQRDRRYRLHPAIKTLKLLPFGSAPLRILAPHSLTDCILAAYRSGMEVCHVQLSCFCNSRCIETGNEI